MFTIMGIEMDCRAALTGVQCNPFACWPVIGGRRSTIVCIHFFGPESESPPAEIFGEL